MTQPATPKSMCTYNTPPARGSPEFLKAPGAAGVQEMDSAVAKRTTTLTRYKMDPMMASWFDWL
eukprot:SAG11_NODE_26986_length_338_cov_1.087866_1_plen_63_part_10